MWRLGIVPRMQAKARKGTVRELSELMGQLGLIPTAS
jgi:hypothetical protein